MKTCIKTLILAFLATLPFSACSGDDYPCPETQDLVGRWLVRIADERVCEDGALWYTLHADGTVEIESYNALAGPNDQATHFTDGKWMLKESEGRTVLEIFRQNLNLWTGEEETHTTDYCILKFKSKQFKAVSRETEFNFIRE